MKRLAALALGVPAILVAGLALGPGGVRAGETDQDGQKVEKRVVVRHAGGSRLGVGLEDTEGDVRGTKVRSVEEGSPAEKAGIQEGDVIVRFDGEAVRSASQLARLVGETPAGRSVAIEVTRGGATQKLSATLAEGSRRVRVFSGDGGSRDARVQLRDARVGRRGARAAGAAFAAARAGAPPRGDGSPRAHAAHAPRCRRTRGAGRATTGTTWSSGCSAADRASWASSTWSRRAARRLLQARREDGRPRELGGRRRAGGQGRDEGRRRRS